MVVSDELNNGREVGRADGGQGFYGKMSDEGEGMK